MAVMAAVRAIEKAQGGSIQADESR
jgi:hypothetical protein